MGTKYIFKQEYAGFQGMSESVPPSTITMEINGELNLSQVLERFEEFLKGCGFQFDGHLDFIPEEEFTGDGHDGMGSTLDTFIINTDNMGSTTSITMPEEHSTYYYDYSRNK